MRLVQIFFEFNKQNILPLNWYFWENRQLAITMILQVDKR